MKKNVKNQAKASKPILEELEARQLFSGGVEGLIDTQLAAGATVTYLDIEEEKQQSISAKEENDTTAAEQQTHELVFVDSAVDDYESLINDLKNQSNENRHFEVILLDNNQNGIEQISSTLKNFDNLDAVHIIAHGSDGSVQLGNTQLDNETLSENNLSIALWANAFAETGDILFYGCNLAETEAGKSLINDISSLTLADVAASTDLTGHESLGGDWTLEFSVGSIEAEVAVSEAAQQQWTEALDISTGLQAHLTFDTDASDTSGNGFDGVLANGAAIDGTNATDKIGDAKLSLDGTDDHVSLDAHTSTFAAMTEGSIAAWVNFTGTSSQTILDIGDGSGNWAALFVDQGKLKWNVNANGVSNVLTESAATYNDGNWHHVAVSVDSGGNRLYVDGVELSGLTYSDGNAASTEFFGDLTAATNTTIGAYYAGSYAGQFGGLIDDFRVYDRALSASDVSELHAYTGVNNAPIVSATALSPTWTEGGGPVAAFSGTSVDAVESGDLINAVAINVTGVADGSAETLVIDGQVIELTNLNSETTANNGFDVDVTVSGSIAYVTITKSGGFTAAATEALIDGVAYDNTSDAPQGAARMVTLVAVQDDGGTANGGQNTTTYNLDSTVTVVAVNDAPVLTSGSAATYSEGNGAAPFIAASLSDIDSVDFNGGLLTYSITSGNDGSDSLMLGGFNGVSVTGNDVYVSGILVGTQAGGSAGSDFTINLNGNATPARVEALYQTLIIVSTGDNPAIGVRTLEVTITDGDGGTSNIGSASADMTTAENDDPSNAGTLPSDVVVTEDVLSYIDLSAIDFADPDANSGELTVTLATSTGGQLTLAGSVGITLGGSATSATVTGTLTNLNNYFNNTTNIQYLHATSHLNGDNADSLNVSIVDNGNTGLGGGGSINLGSVNINITPVNDAPVVVTDSYSVSENATLDVDWFDTAWTVRQTLTFDNSAQGETLVDFPVLVTLDPTPVTGNIDYSKTQDNGEDLRFFAADGTALDYDIEEWNESGKSYVWVKVPQITAGSNTDSMTMYYGNATAVAGEDPQAVWSNGFIGVQQFNDDLLDASGNSNDGVNAGSVTAAGQVADGQLFDGVDDAISLGDDASLQNLFNGGATVSAWIYPETGGENGYGRIFDKSGATLPSNQGWALQVWGANNALLFQTGFSGGIGQWATANGSINFNDWNHVTVSYDTSSPSNTPEIYINGVLQTLSSVITPSGTVGLDAGFDLTVGNHAAATARTFDGVIDDVRIASQTRSADWVRAQYLSSSDAFVSFGGEETAPAISGVLGNDSDLDNDALTVILDTGPANASSFTLNKDGTFSYTPTTNFVGTDSFTYKINDGTDDSSIVSVNVNVVGVADGIRVTPTSLVPIGGETLVNTTTANAQSINAGVSQAIATDASGDYVVVWSSNGQDGSGWGVYAQLFNADGTAQGSELQINSTVTDNQLTPSVAMDDAGNFVVAWQSENQDGSGYGVYTRSFDASGNPFGPETLVNTETTNYQGSPGIAMAPNGDYVVIWTSSAQDPDGSTGIYAQMFNADGSSNGTEFRVNTYFAGYQQVSSVSMDDNGGFVVTWGSENQDGSNYGVFGQIYNADGSTRGSEFQVNTTTDYSQLYNDVVMLPDGRFVVAYQSANADTSVDLLIQRFEADGTPVGGEIQVNSVSDMDYFPIPSITADDSGNFTVVWNDSNDGAGNGVFMRSYDWDGNALTGEQRVNTTTAGDQTYPDVVTQAGGGFIVVWGGNGAGDDDGVFTQRYGLATDEQGGTTTFDLVLESAPTGDVVIPISVSDGSEGSVSLGSVTFNSGNWNIAQTVTVTGLQDFSPDGDQIYTVNIGPATSTDPNFNGLDPADLSVVNFANTAPQMTEWFSEDWDSRKELTISSTQVADDASNFPVLIRLNTDAALAAQALANGDDIVFTAGDGVTQLAHEIEFFDETTGELRAWVKTDLSGTVDTSIYLYFGNDAATNQQNVTGVWDNYVGVYHLDESPNGTAGEILDSSSSGNHGTTEGAMDGADSVTTAIGQGLAFDGVNDKIRIPNSAGLDSISDEATFSLWINYVDAADGQHQIIMTSEDRFTATDGYEWASNGAGEHFFYPDATTPDGNYNIGDNPFTNSTWHHLAATMDFNTKEVKIYVDGEIMGFTSEGVPANWTTTTTSTADLLWGGNPSRTERFFLGMMDEIRIADVARSQEWLQTEFNNQNAPGSFFSIGASEDREDKLTDINEDNFTSAGNTVLSVINSSGADRITDDDSGALEGIAVTAVDDTNGTWQYDANADGSWVAFGAVSDISAVLLDTGALVRFVPDADYNGSAGNLSFQAWDQTAGANGNTGVDVSTSGGNTAYSSETFNSTLNVLSVNDAPTGTTLVVAALEETATAIDISGNVSDIDGAVDLSTTTVTSGPSNGSLTNNGDGTFSYTGDTNFVGSDSFTYTVEDNNGLASSDITVTINVSNANDAPVANADDSHLLFDGTDIVRIADDAALQMVDTVTMEAWFNLDNSATGSQIILNKEGEYELGINADTGEIKFAIAKSDNTWGWHGTGYIINPGEWVHVAVSFDGVAGDAKTYINGQLVDTYTQSGNIGDVYPGFNDLTIGGRENDADERFQGQINDVRVWNTARSEVEIQSSFSDVLAGNEAGLAGYWRLDDAAGGLVNDLTGNGNDGVLGGAEGAGSAPVVDGYTTDEDTVLTIPVGEGVLVNDFDADGDSLTVTNLDTSALLGSLVMNTADGSFSYDPRGVFDSLAVGEIAYETFTYTANDGTTDSNVATVTITVVGTNDAPTGTTLVVAASEETATPIDISGNVSDVDGTVDLSTTTVTSGPSNGSLTNNGDGTFSYTGDTDFVGSDSFTYTVQDNDGQVSSDITVTINVSDINDAPTGTTLVVAAAEETATAIDISGNVSDVDGTVNLSTTIVTSGPSNGSLTNNGDGTFSYTGDTNFVGTDSFTYTVEDNDGQVSADITVTINVSDVNDAPTGTTLVVAASEETATAIDISANVSDVDGTVDLSTTTVTSGPSNGSLTNNGDGTFSYTGDTNFVGSDSFTYTVEDNDGQVSSDITVTINVSDVNDAPTGTTLVVAASEETATAIDISGNVADVDGTVDLTTTTVTGGPSNGSLTNNGDGTFSYTGNTDFVGSDSFTYTVEDNDGQVSSDITVTINVSDINDAPTGTTLVVAATEETATAIDISGNVSDVDGTVDLSTTTVTGGPANGSLTNNGDGTFSYTGDTNFVGSDSFTYTVQDNDGQVSSDITVTINVSDVNDAPTGTNLVVAAAEETATAIDISGNVSDVDGTVNLTTTTVTSGPSNGSLTNNGDGTFSYTGNTDFVGSDSFTYTVQDNDGQVSSDITVTINVSDVNDAPTGTTLVVAAAEETATAIDISGNVSDVDGTVNLTTTTVTSGPSNGSLTNNGDGTFSYTGDTNFVGTDSFTYTVQDNDGQLSSDITVTINVSNVNDAPVITGDSTGSVQEDVAVVSNNIATSGTLNIVDPDSGESSFQAATINGTYGDLVILANGDWTYTADNTQAAIQQLDLLETLTDTLIVQSFDGTNHNIVITINGSEDTAVISGTITGSVTEDTTLTSSGSLSISDTDTSDSPSFPDITSVPSDNGYGTLSMTGGTWTYTLDNNHTAVQALDDGETLTDTYTFTASDSSTQLVTVTIFGANDSPTLDIIISDQVATEDSPFNLTLPANTFSDIDTSDSLVYGATLADDSPLPAWLDFNGDTLTFSGTPTNDDVGILSIKVSASDGSGRVSDTFELTINNVNDLPTSMPVTLTPINEDSGPRLITQAELLANANDVDAGAILSASNLSIISGNGNLTDNGDGTWNYTPAADDDGSVSFAYSISDGYGIVANTATLDILAVNDSPVTTNESYITSEDTPLFNINVLANDSDIDGGSLMVINATATNGSVSINPDGTLNYTPDQDFNGTDTISYTVDDGYGGTGIGYVNMTVNAVSDVVNDNVVTSEDSASVFNVLVNDSFGEDAIVSAVTQGSHGSVLFMPDGTLTYTPHADYHGTDTFTYSVTSSAGDIETATVAITINAVADSVDDTVNTSQPNAISFDPLSNDTFATGASVSDVTQPANGQAVIEANGNITYTPDSSFYGTETFTYSVMDTHGQVESATVVVTVQQRIVTVVELPTINPEAEENTVDSGSVNSTEDSLTTEEVSNEEDPGQSSDVISGAYDNEPSSNIDENITQLAGSSTNANADSNDELNSFFDYDNFKNKEINIRQPEINNPDNLTELLQAQALKDQLENQVNLSVMDDIDSDLDTKQEQALWDRIDAMNKNVEDDNAQKKMNEVEVEIALGSTAGLTAGFISWILRGGSLLASMMSAFPMLNRFDPMTIVSTKTKEKDKKNKSGKSNEEARVDEMFSKKTKGDE